MMWIRRLLVAFWSVLLLTAPALAFQPPPGQAPAGQEEFVPISQLPPEDQLPAAPLLITAYAFVWLAAMFYVWTVWRRLRKVEDDMHALEQRQAARNRTP